jgi:hypothetical protein
VPYYLQQIETLIGQIDIPIRWCDIGMIYLR